MGSALVAVRERRGGSAHDALLGRRRPGQRRLLHLYAISRLRIEGDHPGDRHPVVFVDTPGFDDTFKSDVEILSMIAEWLVTT
jgi:acyl-CoA-binding protein